MSEEWYTDPYTVGALYTLAFNRGILLKLTPDLVDFSRAGTMSLVATPSNYPRELFALAQELQPHCNSLTHTVSLQHDFLATSLESVLITDSFTKKLFGIYEQTRHDNKHTCIIGIYRNDYMLDWNEDRGMSLKQIEFNTISCGLVSFGNKLKSFHEYVSSRYAGLDTVNIPDNPSLVVTVDAIALAWREFNNKEAVVLFVVQPGETNIHDQHAVEFALWERYSIKCVRRTLAEVCDEATPDPAGQLILSGVTCAVVYFRAGYTPRDYPSEKEWEARLLIEGSTASCCPNVADQLVGTKKIQQCLASPGTLEQFIDDPEVVERVRSTFAGLYPLGKSVEGERAIEMALQDPERFVLKPQREGGGNNYYGVRVRDKVREIRDSSEREAYILMDRIRPPPQMGLFMRRKLHVLELKREPMIGELGIYGAYVRKGDRVLLNKAAGHVLRTKPVAVEEGGVMMGASALDSPSLMATEEFIRRLKNTSH